MHPMRVFETPDLYIFVPAFIIQVFLFVFGVRYFGFRRSEISWAEFLTSFLSVLLIDVSPFLFYFGFFGIDLDWLNIFKIAAFAPLLLTPTLIFIVSKSRRMNYKIGKFLISVLIGIFFGILVFLMMDWLYV